MSLKLSLLFLSLLVLSCGGQVEGQFLDKPEKFKAVLDENKLVQLIDVRTPEEFNQGYIEGAVNMDFYNSDFKEKIKTLDKEKPVMVYCAAGGRSGDASSLLKEMGFTEVHDLDGGMNAWKKNKLPVKN